MRNIRRGNDVEDPVRGNHIATELKKFQALYDLAVAMTSEKSLDENLTLVVESCRKLLGADTSSIALRDESTGDLHMHIFSGFRTKAFKTLRIPHGQGLGGRVAETGQGCAVEDYFQEVGPALHESVREEGLITGAAVPIQVGRRNLGVLHAFNRTKTPFSQGDLDTLSLLGNLAAVEIARKQGEEEYRRLYEKSCKAEERLAAELKKFQALYDLAVAMTAEKSLDDNLTLVVESCRNLLGADTSSIALRDESTGDLHMHTSSGFKTEIFKTLRIPRGKGLGGRVAETGQGCAVEDYFQEVAPALHDPVREEGLITGAVVPAQIGRKNLGVLYAFNRTKTLFSQADLDTLCLLGNLAAIEIMRDRAETALRRSEEQFRTIFDCAQDAIFVKDVDRKFRLVNPAMAELYGLAASDFLGHTIEEVLGGKSAKHREEIDLRVLKGETVEMERTMQHLGVSLTLLDIRVPLRNPDGGVVGICGILRNITERKKVDLAHQIPVKDYPSAAMQAILEQARLAAAADGIVLLQGESGSGKDYLARWIHDHSKRADGPFFSINCAALTRELAESELFGHEPGAFTGAGRRKKGLLELAEGGTLLMNEVGELSLALQAKLLTFLDTKSFLRVGGEKSIHINARIIAATHRDLEAEIADGRFLKPLFYRLDVFSILVPPLRERIEDIPILVEDVLTRLAADMQLQEIPLIDPPAMRSLTRYNWPGNIRELRNVLERALMISSDRLRLFPEPPISPEGSSDWSYEVLFSPGQPIRKITDEVSESLCLEAIRRAHGNKTKAASLLGISRPHLYRLMEKFRVPSDSETDL